MVYRSICLQPTAAARERGIGWSDFSLSTCTACTRLSGRQCEKLSFNGVSPNVALIKHRQTSAVLLAAVQNTEYI